MKENAFRAHKGFTGKILELCVLHDHYNISLSYWIAILLKMT